MVTQMAGANLVHYDWRWVQSPMFGYGARVNWRHARALQFLCRADLQHQTSIVTRTPPPIAPPQNLLWSYIHTPVDDALGQYLKLPSTRSPQTPSLHMAARNGSPTRGRSTSPRPVSRGDDDFSLVDSIPDVTKTVLTPHTHTGD